MGCSSSLSFQVSRQVELCRSFDLSACLLPLDSCVSSAFSSSHLASLAIFDKSRAQILMLSSSDGLFAALSATLTQPLPIDSSCGRLSSYFRHHLGLPEALDSQLVVAVGNSSALLHFEIDLDVSSFPGGLLRGLCWE